MPDPHADRAVESKSARANDTVRDAVERRHALQPVLLPGSRVAQIHAAAAHVFDQALDDPAVSAPALEPHAVHADVRDAAVLHRKAAHPVAEDGGVADVLRALGVSHAVAGKMPRGMLKRQPLEGHVAHKGVRERIAREHDEPRRDRRDRRRRLHALAGARDIQQLARLHVVEPLARRIERASVVLERVARARAAPMEERTRCPQSQQH